VKCVVDGVNEDIRPRCGPTVVHRWSTALELPCSKAIPYLYMYIKYTFHDMNLFRSYLIGKSILYYIDAT